MPTPEPTWNMASMRGVLVAGLCIVGFFVGCLTLMDGGCGTNDGGGSTARATLDDGYSGTDDEKVIVYSMAQQFVKERLKAPRTAKFPWAADDYQVTNNGNRYIVVSWVDAQNTFGTLIRTHYVVDMTYLGNDRWRLEDLTTAP